MVILFGLLGLYFTLFSFQSSLTIAEYEVYI
jgi:hypothetical protein